MNNFLFLAISRFNTFDSTFAATPIAFQSRQREHLQQLQRKIQLRQGEFDDT